MPLGAETSRWYSGIFTLSFVKYAMASGITFAVDVLTFNLALFLGFFAVAAHLLAVATALTFSYIANRFWIFSSDVGYAQPRSKRLAAFVSLNIGLVTVSTILVALIDALLKPEALVLNFARILILLAAAVLKFFVYRGSIFAFHKLT